MLWFIYSPFGSYGPKKIAKFNKKVFLGHPIGHAVFVCADSFTYGIFMKEENDDEEEYKKGENESRDDQRGAKKIENS